MPAARVGSPAAEPAARFRDFASESRIIRTVMCTIQDKIAAIVALASYDPNHELRPAESKRGRTLTDQSIG
jgi:hypothetical protein